MANEVKLVYTCQATNAAPATLQAAMAAVALYSSPTADPVLCQGMGLTVESDVTGLIAGTVTRTLVLNMTPAAGPPAAPPFFGVHAPTTDGPAAVYSSSAADAAGGVGAQSVTLTFTDAEGNIGSLNIPLAG